MSEFDQMKEDGIKYRLMVSDGQIWILHQCANCKEEYTRFLIDEQTKSIYEELKDYFNTEKQI